MFHGKGLEDTEWDEFWRSLPALMFEGSKCLSITVVAQLVRVKASSFKRASGMPEDICHRLLQLWEGLHGKGKEKQLV